jgi:transposase-like protein
VEIEQGRGATLEEAARKVGITPQTLVRWRKEYGGLKVDQAKRLKELEQENLRLKRIVANQAIDLDVLKIAASGNF